MSPRISLRRPVTLVLGLTLCSSLVVPAWAGPEAPRPSATDQGSPTPLEGSPEQRAPIGLQLSPAVLEVPTEAGPSRHSLLAENVGSQPVDVVAEVVEFTVTPDGATQFAGTEELRAAAWVDIDSPTFALEPGEQREIEVAVSVPEDAEPGERYVSVVFALPARDGGGNIAITHRVAVKLMIAVPGPQNHLLELGDLTAPRFVDSGAANFDLEVHNRGNMHRRFETPDPLVATSGDAEFRFENFTVLGDSTRVVEAVWADRPAICWCTVEVAVDDGQGNLITASTRVVMFPLRLTLAMLALTAGLAMVLAGRRRRHAERLERQLEAAREQGARSASPGGAASAPAATPPPPSPPAATPAPEPPAPRPPAPRPPAPPPPVPALVPDRERPRVQVSHGAQSEPDSGFYSARSPRRRRSR